MEKGINRYIYEQFDLKEVKDLRTYPVLSLAFIGDGIFDLVVRSIVIGKGTVKPALLHAHTSHFARAEAQADMADALLEYMTEEEADVYRRGRNAHSHTMAKNATVQDYRKATGLEAMLGYLYLADDFERIVELIKIGLERYEAKNRERKQQ